MNTVPLLSTLNRPKTYFNTKRKKIIPKITPFNLQNTVLMWHGPLLYSIKHAVVFNKHSKIPTYALDLFGEKLPL